MQFIDEAKIYVRSGDGGAGCVSFRREAHTPKGGPDGGDGGRGGSIVLEVVAGLNTLIDFRYAQHFKARKGQHGMGKNRTGAASEDVIVKIPVGTQVFLDDEQTMIMDALTPGQRLVVARGGQGGAGNVHFKSSVNQAPRKSTPGEEGEEKWLWLKLKLLSDAGLIGLPNAGKSTFLSRVSRAKPKVADYPFTTLKPQLGVVYVDGGEFVLADIPGLIEGAHAGQGLGVRFLKHVERCGVLLHLVDGTQEDVAEAYKTIRHELTSYSKHLAVKQEVVALNKADALTVEEVQEKQRALEPVCGKRPHIISGATGEGIEHVLRSLSAIIKQHYTDDMEESTPNPHQGYSPLHGE